MLVSVVVGVGIFVTFSIGFYLVLLLFCGVHKLAIQVRYKLICRHFFPSANGTYIALKRYIQPMFANSGSLFAAYTATFVFGIKRALGDRTKNCAIK